MHGVTLAIAVARHNEADLPARHDEGGCSTGIKAHWDGLRKSSVKISTAEKRGADEATVKDNLHFFRVLTEFSPLEKDYNISVFNLRLVGW